MNTANRRLFNQTAKESQLVEQEVRRDDIGFGTKLTDSHSRLINQDGSFNIVRVNGTLWDRLNIYNRLITMGWVQFLSWLMIFYVTANTLFAGIYMLAGAECSRPPMTKKSMVLSGNAFSLVHKRSPRLAMAIFRRIVF